MARHGATRHTSRRKNQGHRMHRKTRLARLLSKTGRGSKPLAWGRGAA